MDDDLFEPSLDKTTTSYVEKPWSKRANLFVAFFGGVLATTVFSFLNGKRLKASPQQMQRIMLVGVAGFVLAMLAYYFLLPADIAGTASTRTSRYAARGVALLAYLIMEYLLKSPRRIYHVSSDGEYESPWKMGLIAVFVVGTVQALIVAVFFLL